MPERQRADARRNHAHILAVAEQEVAAHGADVSLERIARVAGVGSGTVRRHFPGRRALVEAVSRVRIEALAARARELLGVGDSRAALLCWLDEVVDYCVTARGLAAVLTHDAVGADPMHENACSAALEEAAEPLLARAVDDGEVAGEVTVADLITLIVGIVLATENAADHAGATRRLFQLAVGGLSP